MAPIGSELLIEFDVDRVDRYDRILGYLWKDGELLNWRLVREGYALIATYPPNVRYTDHFLTAQEAAREDAAGLWAVDGFACEPSAFRSGGLLSVRSKVPIGPQRNCRRTSRVRSS